MRCGFVYILKSNKNGIYYIGSGYDPDERLDDYNQGRVKATRNKGPWIQMFKQRFPTIAEARSMEYKLKKLKRRDYIEKIIKDGFIKKK